MKECGRREGRTKEDRRKYKEKREGRERGNEKSRKDEEKKISSIYKSDSDEVLFARTIFIFIQLKYPHISIFKRNGHMEVKQKKNCPKIFKYVFLVILPFHCCEVKPLFLSLHS